LKRWQDEFPHLSFIIERLSDPKQNTGTAVRVRFAPSPTGHLHVGNARTALFNWLFARKNNGKFVLRVEDTDVERSELRFEDQLLADLRWLGLEWDEGPDVGGAFAPYRQSDRLQSYRDYAERLLREGKAYLCFCSAEDLQRERDAAMAEGRQPVYSGKCRALDPAESGRRRAAGESCAVRLRIPDRPIRFHDMIRGEVEFPAEVVGDIIIIRSSGMPIYNYVVVIDDIEMKITHVIRGDDHLSNTPKQVALYEALGAPLPEFAHLSTILGSDRERLSKRHGATSIANFREIGILPEALLNYLALLGWAPSGGDREIFSKEELIREFQLARVTPSPAIFDFEKLYWLNRHYVKQIPELRLGFIGLEYFGRAGFLGPELQQEIERSGERLERGWHVATQIWLARVVALFAPAVDRLDQLPAKAEFIFRLDPAAALAKPENAAVLALPKTAAVLDAFTSGITAHQSGSLTADQFQGIVQQVQQETGAKGKELYHPIRITITGSHSGPAFDKVVPLIEEGSRLPLPIHVPSLRERVEAFRAAFDKK
jgi:nondiscriminating glutamyl-tRNA synthetase